VIIIQLSDRLVPPHKGMTHDGAYPRRQRGVCVTNQQFLGTQGWTLVIGFFKASKNGESIQDRECSTSKTSAAATCNSDIPEDAPDVEVSEVQGLVDETATASDCTNQNTADETATVGYIEQTCGPLDQGNTAVCSQGMALDEL